MQLQLAARHGAARETFNLTGIDVRGQLDRLVPAALRLNPYEDSNGRTVPRNNHRGHLFYFLTISEDDFLTQVSFVTRGSENS
jgi:hypothetical protein